MDWAARLAGALRDPQFRGDIGTNLLGAAQGAQQGLTADVLGGPVDLMNMLMRPVGLGAEEPVGGSDWLFRQAQEHGLLPPKQDTVPYTAGRVLGPIAAMGAPKAATATEDALVTALKNARTPRNFRGPFADQAGAIVYHGTPHMFAPTERNPLGEFDLSKIGAGEGAQAYGHGLYVAESPDVAKGYAKETGNLYHIDLPDEHIARMLDWDAPLGAQPESVQKATGSIKSMGSLSEHLAGKGRNWLFNFADSIDRGNSFRDILNDNPKLTADELRDLLIESYDDEDTAQYLAGKVFDNSSTGKSIYERLAVQGGSNKAASDSLLKMGIPGIRFPDELMPNVSNYTLFDPSIANIIKRE